MDIVNDSQVKNKVQSTFNNASSKISGSNKKVKMPKMNSFRIMLIITIVAVLFGAWTIFGYNMESWIVRGSSIQAVDITIGGSNNPDQVYFGKITQINDKVIVLDNVYFIPSSTSGANIQLEPLVCQVHKPFNQMVLDRHSVNWYENLQPSSQVAKAITNYEKANPDKNNPSCPTPAPAKKQ